MQCDAQIARWLKKVCVCMPACVRAWMHVRVHKLMFVVQERMHAFNVEVSLYRGHVNRAHEVALICFEAVWL